MILPDIEKWCLYLNVYECFVPNRLELDVEPFFVSMTLYDSRERKKVSNSDIALLLYM